MQARGLSDSGVDQLPEELGRPIEGPADTGPQPQEDIESLHDGRHCQGQRSQDRAHCGGAEPRG